MVSLLFLFIKQLFSFVDRMVVFVIKYLYQLIVAIADTNVFGNLIYDYLGRIYMFLSVFMVFKLSISIINYVINPDSLSDKSKGFGKLITNVVISLILLAVTPNLFDIAFNLQTDILNSNAIYQIITGKKLATVTEKNNEKTLTLYENAKYSAEQIAFGVYSGFVYHVPNENSDDPTETGEKFGAYCEEKNVKNGCGKKVNGEVIKNVCGNTTCLLDANTVTAKQNKYWWLISTACGCVVAYILLGFCIDTAVRSVKLGFLQIIAPIPIMLRMDPSGKDDKFQKWLKETIKTFISLFIRLAALFFATEVIRTVMNPPENANAMSTYSGNGATGLTAVFVKVFIIIGCLLFAKQFPQLLSDILGIKLDGDGFSLKKKLGNVPGLGVAKTVGAGALGFAGGAAANAYAGIKGWDKTQGFWKNANRLGNSMATGAFSGAFRGARSNEKNMFKAAGAGISGAAAARNLRAERKEIGAGGIRGAASRFGASVSNLAGVQYGASRFDKEVAAYDKFNQYGDALDSYAEKEVLKNKGGAYSNVADLKNKIETLKNAGINVDRSKFKDDSSYNAAYESAVEARSKAITLAETEYYTALSAAKESFIDTNRSSDATVSSSIQEMNRVVSQNSDYSGFASIDLSSGASISSSNKAVKNESKKVKASDDYARAHSGVKTEKK